MRCERGFRSITIAARNLLYYAHKLDAQRINIKWRAWYNCSTLSTATAADAVQFFRWMAMAGEARRRGWLDWRRQICVSYTTVYSGIHERSEFIPLKTVV